MCGITGAMSLDGRPLAADRLKSMVDVVEHRGPDDAGFYLWNPTDGGHSLTETRFADIRPDLQPIDTPQAARQVAGAWRVMLGHRRLSIIDLSAAGHQPMTDEAAGVSLIYNGEIYNADELRRQLEDGTPWRGRSDTEVLLRAYQRWGIECVHRLNGMFAFALWDARKRQLYLARDRYGIKPLYYCRAGGTIVFGSEIKSILSYLGTPPKVDLLALNEYFSFQNILSDRTLFEGIRVLPPATWAAIDLDDGTVDPRPYWDFDFEHTTEARPEDLQDALVEHLQQAVRRQCASDVPIGCYLSGGLDSGTITALAAKHLGRIATFTIGFDVSEATGRELEFDERHLAEKMANTFQTEHYETVLHSGDIAAVMDPLIWHLEDPRVGQSYPNYYAAKLAGRFGKVVMTGVGGDELFGGYPWRYAAAVGSSPEQYIQKYYQYWKRLVSNRDKPRFFTPEVTEQLRSLDDDGAVPFRDHTQSVFRRVLAGQTPPRSVRAQVRQSLYFECKTFLHGLLIVEDKLSMAHSLETRLPFLDNDLVDFACRVPIDQKVVGMDQLTTVDENVPGKHAKQRAGSGLVGKSILRQAIRRILPSEIVNAPKRGFSAPDESWFRGRAENYVRSELLDDGAAIQGYVSPAFLRETLDQHGGGECNHRLRIWSLLCFQKWLQQFLSPHAMDAARAAPEVMPIAVG